MSDKSLAFSSEDSETSSLEDGESESDDAIVVADELNLYYRATAIQLVEQGLVSDYNFFNEGELFFSLKLWFYDRFIEKPIVPKSDESYFTTFDSEKITGTRVRLFLLVFISLQYIRGVVVSLIIRILFRMGIRFHNLVL